MVLSRTLRAGEKTTIGGFEENKLKKEKGLRFTCPSLLMVEAKQMGRGAMACWSQFWRCAGGKLWRSIFILPQSSKEIKMRKELILIYYSFEAFFNQSHIEIDQETHSFI